MAVDPDVWSLATGNPFAPVLAWQQPSAPSVTDLSETIVGKVENKGRKSQREMACGDHGQEMYSLIELPENTSLQQQLCSVTLRCRGCRCLSSWARQSGGTETQGSVPGGKGGGTWHSHRKAAVTTPPEPAWRVASLRGQWQLRLRSLRSR